jgi:hypothetical protein
VAMGTPEYMSPEQVRGEPVLRRRDNRSPCLRYRATAKCRSESSAGLRQADSAH